MVSNHMHTLIDVRNAGCMLKRQARHPQLIPHDRIRLDMVNRHGAQNTYDSAELAHPVGTQFFPREKPVELSALIDSSISSLERKGKGSDR